MPPWKADSHGEFEDERRLTDAEIATIARWADSGAPAHGLIYVNPHDIMITHLGTASLAPRALTTMALFTWFNRFNRAHPMSVQLETLKIAHSLRTSQRRLALSLLLASGLTMVVALIGTLFSTTSCQT